MKRKKSSEEEGAGGAPTSKKARATQQHQHQYRQGVEELVICPISLDRMRDPVMLIKSGITYDREQLCQSLLHFPTKDPKSNVHYDVPLKYAPNVTLRALVTQLYGDDAYKTFDDSEFKSKYMEAWETVMVEKLESLVDDDDDDDDDNDSEFLPFKTLRILAGRGHAKAQFELGLAYNGESDYEYDVEEDHNLAISWLSKAGYRGHLAAQVKLARMYKKGKLPGLEKPNLKWALYWYRKAANRGHAESQYEVGNYYEEKLLEKKAVKWWKKAAAQNHVSAQFKLGIAYDQGDGVRKCRKTAKSWWRKAADQRHCGAMNKLGWYWSFLCAKALGPSQPQTSDGDAGWSSAPDYETDDDDSISSLSSA